MDLPRVMLAAPASGSGKTLITCGLLQALKNRGIDVGAFKCGPDYIDPMFHRKVIGAPSRNLDTFFTGREMTRWLFARAAKERELSVMEGVMGFYDGVAGTTTEASSWDLADKTETPVILVLNAKGMSLSIIAAIRGFLDFKENSRIRGVILNQTSPMIYPQLAALIEKELGIKALGYVPRVNDCVIESRHLGLVTPGEIKDLKARLLKLADILEETLDIDGILKLAQEAPDYEAPMPAELAEVLAGAEGAEKVRIAVARDEAFCFYYEDNLRLLKDLGAELIEFSPLNDREVPEGVKGLILGGGYPELYLDRLEANTSMLDSIRKTCAEVPFVAECGGFMYLHETMEDMEGKEHKVCGVIGGKAFKTEKLNRFGYIELTAGEDNIYCAKGKTTRAHEFHYFDSTENGESFKALKPGRKKSWDCVKADMRSAAGFPHFYYHAAPGFAASFLEACREGR